MMELQNINLLAVLAGAVINMVLGALWYSPMLFAPPWMAAIGKTEEEIQAQGGMAASYAITFVGALISIFTLALIVKWSSAVTVVDGALVGLIVAIGILATHSMQFVVFEGRPRELYF